MTTKAAVEAFLAPRKMALAGASRNGDGFGNIAMAELRTHGYTVYPVNPHVERINGEPCYPALDRLPEKVDCVLVVVHPDAAVEVVREAAAAGIHHVWLQQGAASDEAMRFCLEHHMDVVSGECILMHAAPRGIHKLHRWIWNAIGKGPQ